MNWFDPQNQGTYGQLPPSVLAAIQSGAFHPGMVNTPIPTGPGASPTLYGNWANGQLSTSTMTGPGQFTQQGAWATPTGYTPTGGNAFPNWFGGWDPNNPTIGTPTAPVQQILGQWNPQSMRFGYGWGPTARPMDTHSLAGIQPPPTGIFPGQAGIAWQTPGGQYPGAGVPGYNGGQKAGWGWTSTAHPEGLASFLGDPLFANVVAPLALTAAAYAVAPAASSFTSALSPALTASGGTLANAGVGSALMNWALSHPGTVLGLLGSGAMKGMNIFGGRSHQNITPAQHQLLQLARTLRGK